MVLTKSEIETSLIPLDFCGEAFGVFLVFERDLERDFDLVFASFPTESESALFLDLEDGRFLDPFFFLLLSSSKAALLPLIRVFRGRPEPSILLL